MRPPPHRAGQVALAAVAAFAFLSCLRQINDLDYWTHLAMGRAYVAARSIRIPEPFTGSAPASDWQAPSLAEAVVYGTEWPFQVGLYGVRVLGGDAGVSVAVALCAALAAALLARGLLRIERVGPAAIGALFAGAAVYVARFRFTPRPESLGAVLLALAMLLALRWSERPSWRVLLALAAVLLAWEPLHVTWTLGAVFAAVVVAFAPRLDFWRAQPLALRATAVGASALAAAGVLKFAWRVWGYLRDGGILGTVTEMRPTWEFPSVAVPFAALTAAALALSWGEAPNRVRRLAVWVCAALVGTIVVRNVAFGALAMIPAALEGLRTRRPPPAPRWLAPAIASLGFVGLAFGVATARDPGPGVGVDWRTFPRDAAEYVRRSALPRPVFNSWDLGGFLDWAWGGEPRTFLDGRLGDPTLLAEHDALVEGEAEGVLERRGFRTVLLQAVHRNSGRIVPAAFWFMNAPEWRLVRATDALVFTRTPLPDGVEPVSRAEAWLLVLRLLDALSDSDEPMPHADFSRAVALLQLGEADAARATFARGQQRFADVAPLYAGLGAVLRPQVLR